MAITMQRMRGCYISWYDLCCEFYRQCGLKTKVIPVTTAEYGLSTKPLVHLTADWIKVSWQRKASSRCLHGRMQSKDTWMKQSL